MCLIREDRTAKDSTAFPVPASLITELLSMISGKCSRKARHLGSPRGTASFIPGAFPGHVLGTYWEAA